jgi:hypothetical protein
MKSRIFCLFTVAALAVASVGWSQDLSVAVSSSQYQSGAGISTLALRFLAADSSGRLIVCNQTGTSSADFCVMRVDISGTPVVTKMATAAEILAAVTNAGGTAPSGVTIRGMAVAANGDIVLATDDTGVGAYLFRITAPDTVDLLSGLQSPNTVDGVSRVGCVDNTALVLINDGYSSEASPTDHFQAFDASVVTANGMQAGTDVGPQSAIFGAIGGTATNANVVLNAPVALDSTKLLFANSATGSVTDELMIVDSSAHTVTLAKSRASLLSDLSDTDVGWGAAAYSSASDTVYLLNTFGGAAADDDIIQVPNGGTGTASVFVSDTTLEADSDFPASQNLSYPGDALVSVGGALYLNDQTTNQTYKISVQTAVQDWQLYN